MEGPFFCEAFAMTRRLPVLADKHTFPLRKVGLVVPEDSRLEYAESERAYMLSLSNNDRYVEPIPPTLEDILGALKSGRYDGWHFTGHGSAYDTNADQAQLDLNGVEALRPENLSGEIENLGLRQPLVFLNACQSNQRGLSLTGIGDGRSGSCGRRSARSSRSSGRPGSSAPTGKLTTRPRSASRGRSTLRCWRTRSRSATPSTRLGAPFGWRATRTGSRTPCSPIHWRGWSRATQLKMVGNGERIDDPSTLSVALWGGQRLERGMVVPQTPVLTVA